MNISNWFYCTYQIAPSKNCHTLKIVLNWTIELQLPLDGGWWGRGVVIYRSDQFTTITRPNQTKLSLHHFSLSPSGFVIVNIGIDLSLIPLFPLLRSECRVGLSYTIKSPGRCPILYYKLYIIILYCILLIIILYNKTSPKGTQVKGLKDTRSLNGK